MRYYIHFDFILFFFVVRGFFPHIVFYVCSCLQSDQEPCCTAWVISSSSSSFCRTHKKKKSATATSPTTEVAVAVAVTITVTFRFSNYKLNLLRILFRFQFKSIYVCAVWVVLRRYTTYLSLSSRKTASQHGIEWFHHTKWILTGRVRKHIEYNHSARIYVLHSKSHTKYTQMTKAICCLRKFQHSFLSHLFLILFSFLLFLAFNNWIKIKWVRTNGTDWMKRRKNQRRMRNMKRNIWQLSLWNCVSLWHFRIFFGISLEMKRLLCREKKCSSQVSTHFLSSMQ